MSFAIYVHNIEDLYEIKSEIFKAWRVKIHRAS